MDEGAVDSRSLPPHIDLTDEEIFGALREIPGYVDVTLGDLREIYRRAAARAVERSRRAARDLTGKDVRPARVGMTFLEAGRLLVEQGLQSLPVIDDEGRMVGRFTADRGPP